MSVLKIKITQYQHFIEGDEYFAYLEQPQLDTVIILASCVKQKEYLSMCEKLEGLKFRLEQLGNEVITENVFCKDPNFDSYEEAMDCVMNKK